jgi:uncharacterized protein (TIGR03086 family)
MMDFRDFDRRALAVTDAIVARVDPGQLDGPTPCSAWTLRELLAHMIVQNHGFAAAARGASADLSLWVPRPVGDDPASDFSASAADVTAAFAATSLERGVWLPEISTDRTLPAAQAISFHFVDYVVHGWDVAAAIGVRPEFDEDILEAVLPIARAVPDGANRLVEGASFQPGLPSTAGAALLDQVLLMLGRSPNWPDPAGNGASAVR